MINLNEIKSNEQFQMFLNAAPKVTEINKLARGAKYVPIGEVEKQLDELFAGLWQTKNFEIQVVANEIVGSIQLDVFHPVAQIWVSRTGVAAVQIMVAAGTEAVLQNKIKNALETGFPKLKAECVKNAARSLGNLFGRNLNRKTAVSKIENLSEKITKNTPITQDHPNYAKAVAALEQGTPLETIEKHYKIAPETRKILLTIKPKENEKNV